MLASNENANSVNEVLFKPVPIRTEMEDAHEIPSIMDSKFLCR